MSNVAIAIDDYEYLVNLVQAVGDIFAMDNFEQLYKRDVRLLGHLPSSCVFLTSCVDDFNNVLEYKVALYNNTDNYIMNFTVEQCVMILPGDLVGYTCDIDVLSIRRTKVEQIAQLIIEDVYNKLERLV